MLGPPAGLCIPWRTTPHAGAARERAAGRSAGRSTIAGIPGRSRALACWTLAAGGALMALAPAAALAQGIPPRLARSGSGAVLELASGQRLELALPAGATLDAAVTTTGNWVAAGTAPAAGGAGSELLLLTGSLPPARAAAAEPQRLPVPAGRPGAVRAEPLLLVEDGSLAGLVWLEGASQRSFRVCYAAWNGASWAAPQTLSPGGPGNQLALTAARLADGSWLLAWSGFDGQADAIVWSQGRKGVWSRPRALAGNPSPNTPHAAHAPNITPTLAAAGGGALIAWSQLASGGYRLLVARFADGVWSAAVEAAAGGAIYPTFEASPDVRRARLLYRDAARRTWAALDLDATGRPLRSAALPGPAPGTAFDRPALLAGSTANVSNVAGVSGGSDVSDTANAGKAADMAVFHWTGGDSRPADQTAAWAPFTQPEPPALRAQRESGGEARPKAGPPIYIAFGDSITAGFGDSADEGGYPGRLQGLLTTATGAPVTVVNAGLFGETTGEGLARIGSVLQPGATGLLLMEGTNDITARVSLSTTVQNLDAMASQAEASGITAYHATIIPRLPTADFDANNDVAAALAGAIRELAWERGRGLIDPFEVFFVLNPNYMQLYVGGTDKLHPNPAGYTLLAQTFANVLEGIDDVPPVPGVVSPPQGQENVPADSAIEVDLFDFGAGIDVASTQLLINDQVVDTTPTGDQHKLVFLYQPPAPLAGVVNLGVQTQDLASPPNTFTGTLSQFIIVGTVFLTGDLNHDGIVDGLDLLLFAPCFGAHRYNTNFQVACDFNGDGVVDGVDLAMLANNFGKRSF
jgi:acyl-CoA thioesterase-1